jgi:hypothetical protein
VAVFLLWLPWLPTFVSQAADVYRRFWLPVPTLGTVLSVIGAFLCDASPWSFPITVVVNGLLACLALVGLRASCGRSDHALLLGGMFLAPFVGQWLVSLCRPILYARTLIWASVPLYVLMAAGVCCLSRDWSSRTLSTIATLAAMAGLVTVSGVALHNYYVTFEKEAWDEGAALVAEGMEPNDLLLFNAAWGQVPFDYYFGQLYNPRSESAVAKRGLPVDLFDRGVLEPEMRAQDLSRLQSLLADRQRVWLIYSHQWYTDPQGLIPEALTTVLHLQGKWNLNGLEIHLYVKYASLEPLGGASPRLRRAAKVVH